jgi:hypothetical protein
VSVLLTPSSIHSKIPISIIGNPLKNNNLESTPRSNDIPKNSIFWMKFAIFGDSVMPEHQLVEKNV